MAKPGKPGKPATKLSTTQVMGFARVLQGHKPRPQDLGDLGAYSGAAMALAAMPDWQRTESAFDVMLAASIPPADIERVYQVVRPAPIGNTAEAPPARQWHIRTVKEAFEAARPIRYAVKPLVPVCGVTTIYGLGGSLKSMLALAMAVCVATGTPFLQPRPGEVMNPFKTKRRRVLWIDTDNGTERTAMRIAAVARGYSLAEDDPDSFMWHGVPDRPIDVATPTGAAEFESLIRGAAAQVVFVDHLAHVIGDTDLNKPEMAVPMQNLRGIAERLGVALVVIHHENKGGNTGRGASVMGSNYITNGSDYILRVQRPPEGDIVIVSADKERDAAVNRFAAEFSYESLDSEDADGDPETILHMAKFWQVPIPEDAAGQGGRKANKAAEAAELALAFLRKHGELDRADLLQRIVNTMGGEDVVSVATVKAGLATLRDMGKADYRHTKTKPAKTVWYATEGRKDAPGEDSIEL